MLDATVIIEDDERYLVEDFGDVLSRDAPTKHVHKLNKPRISQSLCVEAFNALKAVEKQSAVAFGLDYGLNYRRLAIQIDLPVIAVLVEEVVN